MADKIEPRIRNEDNPGGTMPDFNTDPRKPIDKRDDVETPGSYGHTDPARVDQETGNQRVPTEEEIRTQLLDDIDNTEILDEGTSTQLYRRAIADFDPDETEAQLSEHYVFRDEELEKKGYF